MIGVSPTPVEGTLQAPGGTPLEETRLQVFTLDYLHVQIPFEITLWILLASLAKIDLMIKIFHLRKVIGLDSRLREKQQSNWHHVLSVMCARKRQCQTDKDRLEVFHPA
ncbi:UNVERIFIED_CONTAM: hypothetical protein K2H54_040462 [Gekko kuhli]